MRAISLRTLTFAVILVIVGNAALLIGGASWLKQRLADTHEQWQVYRDYSSPRAIALVDMVTQLGYAGAIHNLENFILRQDPRYLTTMRNSVGAVRGAVLRYRTARLEPAEAAALDVIEATARRLGEGGNVAERMLGAGASPQAVRRAIDFDLEPTMAALTTLDEAVARRRAQHTAERSNLETLYGIRRALGLGGMIDRFKDVVLFGDADLVADAQESLRKAGELIATYRSEATTAEEQAALDDISSVLDRYAVLALTAGTMAAAGATPSEIDAVVKVDDGPAVAGLQSLDLAVAARAAARVRLIDSNLASVLELSSGFVDLSVLTSLVVCALVAWTLMGAVQRPLSEITRGMEAVVQGRQPEQRRAASHISEVIALGRALGVFRTYAEELARHAKTLQRFQELSTDSNLAFEERLDRILRYGLEHFGMTLGTVSRTADGVYEVQQSVGLGEESRPRGDRLPLDTTYCRHALERGGGVAFNHVSESRIAGSVCHRTYGREAYVGAPIVVDGSVFGTVNFSARLPRAQPFTEGDIVFVELIARWLGMEFEREGRLEQLALARDEAESAARTKSEFLANMSHEIRTPMNAVIGLTGLALKTDLSDKTRDYLEKISRSARSLLRIINDILDFSKIEANRLTIEHVPFDLDEMLQDVATMTGDTGQLDKGVELVFSVAPEIPRALVGDPFRLSQVLVNLVSNAMKFTEAGEIVVRIAVEDLPDGRIRMRVSVSDTGIGMTPEQLDRIFQAFSQADGSTSRRFGGTGLGLRITKQLVELMGGAIEVESEAGAGSVFRFTVELERGEATDVAVLPTFIEPAKCRILVAEDNAVTRSVLVDTLHRLNFLDVQAVATGEEAVQMAEQARELGEKFDIAIVDWRMPGIDGIETARRLRSMPDAAAAPAVVLVTAYAGQRLVDDAESAGISKVLFKPLSVSSLLDGIVDALDDGAHLRAVSRQATAPASDAPDRLQGARVLVVEDNEINQQIARELLEGAGAEVTVADSGAAALTLLRAAASAPHVVLMDLQMPEMDGYEATRLIQAEGRWPDLPVIAMTAHVTAEERERCQAAGMVGHVGKPVDVEQLLGTVERWALGRRDGVEDPVPVRPESPPASGRPPAVLDIEGTMRRLGLPADAMMRAAARFAEAHADAPATLDRHLAEGETEAAGRYAHTLVGLAGTIGAEALASEARTVEKALAARPAERPDLSAFRDAHAAAFSALANLDLPGSAAKAREAAPGGHGQPGEPVAALLAELDAGLACNRLAVRWRGDELAAAAGARFDEAVARFESALDDLDYPAARAVLREIADGLKVELPSTAVRMPEVGPTILVVDDEPTNVELLGGVLEDDGDVLFATTGSEAVALAAAVRPDVILLDVVMPGMDGQEACRQLKESPATAGIPVIFVSAKQGEADQEAGLDVGAADFLTKPFNVRITQARVRTQLEIVRLRHLLADAA